MAEDNGSDRSNAEQPRKKGLDISIFLKPVAES